MTLLTDLEWKEWSDREIAKRCRVGNKFVGDVRRSLCPEHSEKSRIYKTKHGTTTKMNTANIGKRALNTLLSNHVTVKSSHPLFPSQSDIITQSPNPDAVMVEQDNGTSQVSVDLTVAHHLQLEEGGLVEIHAPNNNKINGRLARIAAVHESTVDVWIRDVNTMTMDKHTLKQQQVEPMSMEREPQLLEVGDRITKLRKCNLDPFEVEILLLLERQVAFTPVELRYLAQMEQFHGITNA